MTRLVQSNSKIASLACNGQDKLKAVQKRKNGEQTTGS